MRSDASASVSVAPRRVKHRAPDAPRISDDAERLLAGDDQQDDPAEAARALAPWIVKELRRLR